MQHDDVIWGVINPGFCSFKVKTKRQMFCRNKYNVSGLCTRSSCPLANSRYATVLERQGNVYLYVKTIERAHSPKKLWEKIKLSPNYATALQQIDDELQFWPQGMVHRSKQRFTKIIQYLMRMRRLELKSKPKLVTVNRHIEKREEKRETKALIAAQLQKSIEKELLERFRKGTYDGIHSFPQRAYEKALDALEEEEPMQEEESDMDDDEEYEDEMDYDEDDEEAHERQVVDDDDEIAFVEAYEEDDDEDDDLEDFADRETLEKQLAELEASKKKRKRPSSAGDKQDGKKPKDDKASLGKRKTAGDGADQNGADNDAGQVRKPKKPKTKKKKAHVSIEYEEEHEMDNAAAQVDY